MAKHEIFFFYIGIVGAGQGVGQEEDVGEIK